MGTQLVRTLEAVRFLNDYAPAKLERLRSIYPDVPLSTKKMLGGVVEDEFDASMAKIELTVVVAALREVGPASPLAMNRSNVRMRAARRLTLASTMVGVVKKA